MENKPAWSQSATGRSWRIIDYIHHRAQALAHGTCQSSNSLSADPRALPGMSPMTVHSHPGSTDLWVLLLLISQMSWVHIPHCTEL